MATEAEHGTITIKASASREVEAEAVDALVTIEGRSFVYGNEALTKAAEVRQFVEALRTIGVPEEAIAFEGLSLDLSTGLLSRSTAATYSLRVRCRPVGQVGFVLSCVAGQKNISLTALHWRYPRSTELREELLTNCLAEARRRGELVAQGLGVPVVGVLRYSEEHEDPERVDQLDGQGIKSKMMRAKTDMDVASMDFGATVAHRSRHSVYVEVAFRVGPRQS